MAKDYYGILGISKTATEDEIKKAYKKGAMKWHPDRNSGNEEKASAKFKEISEAYEVLVDPQKKAVYDQFGEEGLKGGAGPSGPSPFGGGGQSFHFSSSGAGPHGFSGGFRPSDANDIFKQFFGAGGMDFGHSDMDGMGGPFASFSNFPSAARGKNGFGNSPFGNQQPQANFTRVISRPLPINLEDLYKGTVKKLKITKKLLNGGQAEKIIEIGVKAGYKAGTKIKYAGEGDQLPDGTSQDIEFVLEEKPHSLFKREGDNLKTKVTVSLEESLLGFSKSVTSLDGRVIPLTSQRSPISPNSVMTIPGEGMPNSKTGRKGDLHVTVEVVYPSRLTSEQRSGIAALFP